MGHTFLQISTPLLCRSLPGSPTDLVLGDLGEPVDEAGLVAHFEAVEVADRRDEGLLQDVAALDALAQEFSLSRRSVFRILARGRENGARMRLS